MSAYKRRLELGGAPTADAPPDMSNIAPRLWVGAAPPFDRDLPDFDILVLCAREIQPPPEAMAFTKQVIRVPLPDAVLTVDEQRRALQAARWVAEALAAGRRVLVTCRAGLNRSALVASLALGMVTHMSAPQILALVRERRSATALHNPHFVDLITKYVGIRQRHWLSSAVQAARRRAR